MIRIVIEGSGPTAGDLDTFGVPDRRPRLLRAVRPKVVHVSSDHVPFDIKVNVRRRRIRSDHDLETIVFGNVSVMLLVPRGDELILRDVGDVQVFVIPKQLRESPLFLSGFPPGEVELSYFRRCKPGRFIELPINLDRCAGAVDRIRGWLPGILRGSGANGHKPQDDGP